MKKTLSIIISVTLFLSIVFVSSIASADSCSVCRSTGKYSCTNSKCPDGIFCPECKIITLGFQPKCSKCRGSGTQNIMGTRMPCSNCLGQGESVLEFVGGQCENCRAKTVCSDCYGFLPIDCPYCNTDGYQEFVYNKVMREPLSSVGNNYQIRGRIVETKEEYEYTDIRVKIQVNDDTNIVCSVMYKPAKDFKLLVGDDVLLYAKMIDVDEKNTLPEFFSARAELAE